MIAKVEITVFIQHAGFQPLMCAAKGEYAMYPFPGAFNLPLLNNEERAFTLWHNP